VIGLLVALILGVVVFLFSGITDYLRKKEREAEEARRRLLLDQAKEQRRAAQEASFRTLSASNVDNMDGLSFECFVATLLEHEGFTRVEITKGSGDFGVDIIATKGSY